MDYQPDLDKMFPPSTPGLIISDLGMTLTEETKKVEALKRELDNERDKTGKALKALSYVNDALQRAGADLSMKTQKEFFTDGPMFFHAVSSLVDFRDIRHHNEKGNIVCGGSGYGVRSIKYSEAYAWHLNKYGDKPNA